MSLKNRVFSISSAVILVLLVNLLLPVAALADDATPPAPTEEPIPTEEPSATEDPASPPDPEPESTPEPLPALPDGVDIVILNEDGTAEPLATEAAAEAVTAPDPYFTVGVTTYTFTATDCDPDTPNNQPCSNPIQAAINYLAANNLTPNDGNVYVESGTYEENVIIDGASWTNTPVYLGLIGASGSLNTILDGYISVLNMNAFTLEGFTIIDDNSSGNDSYFMADGNSGNIAVTDVVVTDTFGTGIDITNQTGDVNLNSVISSNNAYYGAYIETDGNVEITDSTFNSNGLTSSSNGIYASATGNITITSVTASNNALHGVELVSGDSVNVFDGEFNGNGFGWNAASSSSSTTDLDTDNTETVNTVSIISGHGIFVVSTNDITLDTVSANANANDGANLGADYGNISVENSWFAGNGQVGQLDASYLSTTGPTISEHFFNIQSNAGSGLRIEVGEGSVTLLQVYANENGNYGTLIDATTIGNIDVLDSQFNANGWSAGIFGTPCPECGYTYLYDYLDDLCSANTITGMDLYNPCGYADGTYIMDPLNIWGASFAYDVNVHNDSGGYSNEYSISQSGGIGLSVSSANGTIITENIEASDNAGRGAELFSPNNITLTNNIFQQNGFGGNLSFGECVASGDYQCIEADLNHDNSPDALDYSSSNYVDVSYADGLRISSNYGNITLNQVFANYNGSDGADLDSGGMILIENSEFNGNGPYGIGNDSEIDLFADFPYGPLGLDDSLPIPVSELEMGNAYFEAGILSAGRSYLYFETGTGLEVDEATLGITINNIQAEDNGGFGAIIFTSSYTNITGSSFNNNGYINTDTGLHGSITSDFDDSYHEYHTTSDGLYIYSDGAITLTGITSETNAFHGANLYTYSSEGIYITDSSFLYNGFDAEMYFEDYNSLSGQVIVSETYEGAGIHAGSQGPITVDHVYAISNQGNGAELQSDGSPVIVICGDYSENGGYGVHATGASYLGLYGPVIDGNILGDAFFAGRIIYSTKCLIPDPVSEGDDTPHIIAPTINREGYACSERVDSIRISLPSGDHIVLPCPINDFATLKEEVHQELPAALPENTTFISGMTARVIAGEKELEEIDAFMLVSFVLPRDMPVDKLSILYWNGRQWIELGGVLSEDEEFFETITQYTGTFVLVSK